MDQWSSSGIQPGQFTGDTGIQALSQDELEPARPAWTRTVCALPCMSSELPVIDFDRISLKRL